jgi:hypothetical protein
VIRVVPRVERGEFVNAGVVLFCRARRFLGARVALDAARLAALAPDLDADDIRARLALIPHVCAGGPDAGPIGRLSQTERFHWLVAPSSTVLQPSPVHAGLCHDPVATLDRLLVTMVLPPVGPPDGPVDDPGGTTGRSGAIRRRRPASPVSRRDTG